MYRILLLTLMVIMGSSLLAQTTGERTKTRAKARAEQRANNRLDQKVDQGVDKAFNAVEGLFKKRKKKNAPAKTTQSGETTASGDQASEASETAATRSVLNALGMGGDSDFEPFTNEVHFSLIMQMTTTDKKGKTEEMNMHIGIDRDEVAMVIQGEKGERNHMIYNTQDNKTTTITTDKNGKREGFRMRMPNLSGMQAATEGMEEKMNSDHITFERTGQRKTIDGYDCELYIMRDTEQDITSESWLTQDVELSIMDVYTGMASITGGKNNPMANVKMPQGVMDGFPILTTMKDGKETYVVHYKDIRVGEAKLDASLFDTSGVNIQEVGF